MEQNIFPLLMVLAFLTAVVLGRVIIQRASTGDSGIRLANQLQTTKEVVISLAMFGTWVAQLLLALLYAGAVIVPQISVPPTGLALGLALCLTGILLACYSQHVMGRDWRIGVKPDEKTQLVTKGIYSKIRNPIYTASIIHGIGLLLLAPNVLFLTTGILGFYFIRVYVKKIEEPYLLAQHGDEYLRYMKNTGSFLPKFNLLSHSHQ